jgi:hypothetical protein
VRVRLHCRKWSLRAWCLNVLTVSCSGLCRYKAELAADPAAQAALAEQKKQKAERKVRPDHNIHQALHFRNRAFVGLTDA